MRIVETWESGTDDDVGTSPRLFKESEEDLFEGALVVSERAGHDEAPMTGPTSEAPLDGLFQTGFFPALPWPPDSSDFSSPAAATASTVDREAGGATDTEAIGSIGVFGWGEEGAAAIGSGSPRTIWVHGEETCREGRRDCAAAAAVGLPCFSVMWRGEIEEEEEELELLVVADAISRQKN